MDGFVKQFEGIISNLDESQLKVEKHAFDVINSSDTSLNLVKDGIVSIEDIVKDINDMNVLVEKSAENIEDLKHLSNLIEEFADVINKIAGKTNMLSLNASIEAARAGEHGKGFSVVAGQVGELAAQSTKSSKDITDTVKQVHSFVEVMVKALNDMCEISKRQHEKTEAITDILNKILEGAVEANNKSREVEHEIAYQRDITDEAKNVLENYVEK